MEMHGHLFQPRAVAIVQAEGGSDKGFDGSRKDTRPIVEALTKRGVLVEVVFYRDEWAGPLLEHLTKTACAYISRVNPGTIPSGEEKYFEFLHALSARGLVGMPTPDMMTRFGAKDSLSKLAGTGLVPDDTFAFTDKKELWERFPLTLSTGERVIKQNRGSTGSGIWRVRVAEGVTVTKGTPVPLETRVKCTEAVDNHTEYHTLGGFLEMCEQYIDGPNGLVVDMRFLPRIKEGEVRVLMVGSSPVFVVHKKPADGEDAFSATLFSGARYTYDSPNNWPVLTQHLQASLPVISERVGGFADVPLLWTADFILDWHADGTDAYYIGEFNCSCVGFTGHEDLGIQDMIAEEVIRRVTPPTTTTPSDLLITAEMPLHMPAVPVC